MQHFWEGCYNGAGRDVSLVRQLSLGATQDRKPRALNASAGAHGGDMVDKTHDRPILASPAAQNTRHAFGYSRKIFHRRDAGGIGSSS